MPDWMHAISAWATVHKDQLTLWATIASAAGAAASALAAIVVMFLTRTLAKDNSLLRKAGTEPEVVAYLLPDERHLNILNLVVTNVGRGTARNVELEFIGDLDALRKIGAFRLVKPRIPVLPWLPQDERFVQMFGNSIDLMREPNPPEFLIHVHFENSQGTKTIKASRINIAEFDGLSRTQSAEHETTEALKSIAKSLDAWNGSRRLKIDMMTAKEIEAEALKARRSWQNVRSDATRAP